MKKLTMKTMLHGTLLSLALLASQAQADDTELFFSGVTTNVAPPLLMFSLDWRSNLGSTFCTDASTASCRDSMGTGGTKIYDAMDFGPQDAGGLYISTDAVTLFDTFRAVFKLIFESTLMDGMSVGLMMNHENGCSGNATSGCSNGGYILRGFEIFEAGDANGAKAELLEIMADIPVAGGAEAHPYQGKELFLEFYRYLTGQKVLRGDEGWDDYASQSPGGTSGRNLNFEFGRKVGGQTCAFGASGETRACENYTGTGPYNPALDSNLNKDGDRISSAVTWDPTIMNSGETRYVAPYDSLLDWSCSKTFTINMMFQVSQQEDSLDDELKAAITSATGDGGLAMGNKSTFPGVISALKNLDHASSAVGVDVDGNQDVTSFFYVSQANTTTHGYAAAGGTNFARDALSDPGKLLADLTTDLGSINSVSTSFVSVTVPVNAENRTSALDNLFLALFKVDPNGYPLWLGNVKRLELVENIISGDSVLSVEDALGNPPFNPVTGRLKDDVLTIWADPLAEDVVNFDATVSEMSGRDGGSVNRGGSGHKVPGFRPIAPATQGDVGLANSDGLRQVYLEAASFDARDKTGNALIDLNADDASPLLDDMAIQKLLTVRNADETLNTSFVQSVISNAATEPGVAYDYTDSDDRDLAAINATQVLLKWVRGVDVFDWDADTFRDDVREWLWADVLHSRPLAINYGALGTHSSDNQDVRLIFGTNDGLIHFIRNTAAVATAPSVASQTADPYGEEVWALMPRQLLSIVPDLLTRANVGDDGHPYGVDGEPVLFTIDNDKDGTLERGAGGNDTACVAGGTILTADPLDKNCDKAYVYIGLRRGGNSYFALDVSDPDDLPRLLWRLDDTGDFSEMAMSFATPRVGWVQFEPDGINEFGGVAVPTPVLFISGGYYGGWDATHTSRIGKDDLTNTADDPKGNAIFMVHARTGELIWKAVGGASTGGVDENEFTHADMDHSIPAPVIPMDYNGNRIIDRLYVGDSHGQVWRVDLPEYDGTDPDQRENNWKVNRLADFSGTGTADVRFFHSAQVVQSSDGLGLFDAVVLGSGDRAHPQSEATKQNWFFMIKDRVTISGSPSPIIEHQITSSGASGYLVDITDTCLNQTDAGCSTNSGLQYGWRLKLEEPGEKALSSPLVSADIVTFTTYLPLGTVDEDSCVPLGRSRIYQTKIADGSPLPFLHPDAVEGSYTKTDRYLDLFEGIDGGVVAVSPDTGLTSSGFSATIGDQKPTRFYWRERNIDILKK